jgi:hypothetical protein
MKQKSQFKGFVGLKMFSNIIQEKLFILVFWKKELAVFSYQDENRTKWLKNRL